MSAIQLILIAILVMALAYRYYGAFLAAKVVSLDLARTTPAHTLNDAHDYAPTNKWVLFGHHFAAISGAGPLIGPVLAAQFGYAPSFIWMLFGAVLAGGVHDFMILIASIRRDGKSLAEIARQEVSPLAGAIGSLAVVVIIILALAGLGLAVVKALHDSSWGTFTIAATIPIAVFVGLWMFKFRKGHIAEASIIGVVAILAAVAGGYWIPGSRLAGCFTLSEKQLITAIAVYGFIASVLPVWLLLCPRDYLSSYLKIGTIAALVIGVIVVNPELKMPAITQYIDGGGPVISGKLFPFLFITIACGAISGFHALVSSGTTPKMICSERDAPMIGYGAMLVEGIVSIIALIAACSLDPADYFAINVSPEKFAALGMTPVNIDSLCAQVGENVKGRTGGAVSLAVGFAQIFAAIPGLSGLMKHWYHFAIMFEALFILTTIDAGTRVARFLVQEGVGRVWKPMARTDWLPGSLLATSFVVFAWAYFIWTGSISTIWPMFGTANQLLAGIALSVATTALINAGRVRYAWVTLIPMVFVSATTLYACYRNMADMFIPMIYTPQKELLGCINTALTALIMTCALIILVETARRSWRVLVRGMYTSRGKPVNVSEGGTAPEYGEA